MIWAIESISQNFLIGRVSLNLKTRRDDNAIN